MPVSESNISSAFITVMELVIEELEFRLRRETSTLHHGIRRKVVVGRDDRPMLRHTHRDWIIECTDLNKQYLSERQQEKIRTI
jgi:hypothetical protein